MTAQYQLNAKAILDKQFNVDLKGYAPREVDEFLDKVIADYQTYDETIREGRGRRGNDAAAVAGRYPEASFTS